MNSMPIGETVQPRGASAAVALRAHAPGLILAGFFFCIYLYLGLLLNSPGIDTTDNFLDADNYSWMRRIAWVDGGQLEMRGPHPFAYLIFRPLGWSFKLFVHDPFLSALLLNTLVGGLCVFLAWLFIRNATQNTAYALLISALLGMSTSHLWFGSIIESYIFSAAALIAGFTLLQSRKDATLGLILAALITLGITVTNGIQSILGFLIARRSIKDALRFVGLVSSIGLILSLIHAAWYPSSVLFFQPGGAQAEQDFSISILQEPAWRAVGRIVLIVRTILFYTVIAPRPFVFSQDVGGTFPRFNFFRIAPGEYAFSSYHGLGNVLVFTWVGMLLAAGFLFVRNLIRFRKSGLSLAFLLCLGFNFLLHIGYGYEPFLYSPDWAYALVFFVALNLGDLADSRWFQAGLFAFLMLLAYNQWQFFEFVLETTGPLLK